jgi:thymidylate kinase
VNVVVDGAVGTGKTTLVEALRLLGFTVSDRGAPSRMVQSTDAGWEADEIYLILDAPTKVCRARAGPRGADISPADWVRERQRYRQVATELPHAAVVDASGTQAVTLERSLTALCRLGLDR